MLLLVTGGKGFDLSRIFEFGLPFSHRLQNLLDLVLKEVEVRILHDVLDYITLLLQRIFSCPFWFFHEFIRLNGLRGCTTHLRKSIKLN